MISGCNSCLLHTIKPSLAAKVREIEDYCDIERSDIAIVILGTDSTTERERARDWMRGQFPEVQIKMEDELVGAEVPFVISIGNFNMKQIMTLVNF